MNSDRAQEISERDQLWASLRILRPEIDRLADGSGEMPERDAPLIRLLARIVAAELDFRQPGSSE